MNRAAMLDRLRAAEGRAEPFDVAVIGGGATGLGIAVDAASRGCSVALLEQDDFGKGTSSRSTKLVHGGVRYLEQGNIALVMEALKERGLLRQMDLDTTGTGRATRRLHYGDNGDVVRVESDDDGDGQFTMVSPAGKEGGDA